MLDVGLGFVFNHALRGNGHAKVGLSGLSQAEQQRKTQRNTFHMGLLWLLGMQS